MLLELENCRQYYGIDNNYHSIDFPKTYEECLEVLGSEVISEHPILNNFIKLLNCRNAFYKLMNWNGKNNRYYVITNCDNKITQLETHRFNYILKFPDPYTRILFETRFKDIIQEAIEFI